MFLSLVLCLSHILMCVFLCVFCNWRQRTCNLTFGGWIVIAFHWNPCVMKWSCFLTSSFKFLIFKVELILIFQESTKKVICNDTHLSNYLLKGAALSLKVHSWDMHFTLSWPVQILYFFFIINWNSVIFKIQTKV